MNILVTGANGFVGKNLIANLNNIKNGKNKNGGIPTFFHARYNKTN